MPRPRAIPNWLTTILGCPLSEIEWSPAPAPRGKVSNRERKKLKAIARRQGKQIADDWLADARKRAAEIGEQIRADVADQIIRDEQAEQLADLADSIRIAEQLTEAALPEIQRAYNAECAKLRQEIARDREKIQRAGKRIARAKLSRFKNRR